MYFGAEERIKQLINWRDKSNFATFMQRDIAISCFKETEDKF